MKEIIRKFMEMYDEKNFAVYSQAKSGYTFLGLRGFYPDLTQIRKHTALFKRPKFSTYSQIMEQNIVLTMNEGSKEYIAYIHCYIKAQSPRNYVDFASDTSLVNIEGIIPFGFSLVSKDDDYYNISQIMFSDLSTEELSYLSENFKNISKDRFIHSINELTSYWISYARAYVFSYSDKEDFSKSLEDIKSRYLNKVSKIYKNIYDRKTLDIENHGDRYVFGKRASDYTEYSVSHNPYDLISYNTKARKAKSLIRPKKNSVTYKIQEFSKLCNDQVSSRGDILVQKLKDGLAVIRVFGSIGYYNHPLNDTGESLRIFVEKNKVTFAKYDLNNEVWGPTTVNPLFESVFTMFQVADFSKEDVQGTKIEYIYDLYKELVSYIDAFNSVGTVDEVFNPCDILVNLIANNLFEIVGKDEHMKKYLIKEIQSKYEDGKIRYTTLFSSTIRNVLGSLIIDEKENARTKNKSKKKWFSVTPKQLAIIGQVQEKHDVNLYKQIGSILLHNSRRTRFGSISHVDNPYNNTQISSVNKDNFVKFVNDVASIASISERRYNYDLAEAIRTCKNQAQIDEFFAYAKITCYKDNELLLDADRRFSVLTDAISIANELNRYQNDEARMVPNLRKHMKTFEDIQAWHDEMVGLQSQLTVERYATMGYSRDMSANDAVKNFEKRYNKAWKDLEFEHGDFVIRAPHKPSDLIFEGVKLNHCVKGKGYIDKVLYGLTIILFIRKKDNPDEPYFTMEVRDGFVRQVHGNHNCLVSSVKEGKDLNEFITLFANKYGYKIGLYDRVLA